MYVEFILNYFFAWIAVLLGIFLLTKYLIRRSVQKIEGERRQFLGLLNRSMKLPHILIGFTLIAVGSIHGLYSSVEVWSLNLGTVTWVLTICFSLTWTFRKFLKVKWLQMHRALAIIIIPFLVWHVVDVGGINVFRILSEIKSDRTYQTVISEMPNRSPENNAGVNASENYSKSTTGNNDMTRNNDSSKSGSVKSNSVTDRKEMELPYYFAFDGLDLADGIYEAEVDAYGPGLKVEIEIEKNILIRIKILSHHEVDSKYYKPPMQKIPADIIHKQTLDVDMVTGATQTSLGIIKAVRKAVLESMEQRLEK